jgi:hypothetical protein
VVNLGAAPRDWPAELATDGVPILVANGANTTVLPAFAGLVLRR